MTNDVNLSESFHLAQASSKQETRVSKIFVIDIEIDMFASAAAIADRCGLIQSWVQR
jgi:hypothetical protein